jgi:hypothetical protein
MKEESGVAFLKQHLGICLGGLRKSRNKDGSTSIFTILYNFEGDMR